MSDLPSVTATELPADVVLIDVREPDEWASGHAPGAIHIPLGEIPTRFGELPSSSGAVITCRVGGRSAQAATFLLEQGYECRNLTGGMLAYEAAGLELESDNGQPPVIV